MNTVHDVEWRCAYVDWSETMQRDTRALHHEVVFAAWHGGRNRWTRQFGRVEIATKDMGLAFAHARTRRRVAR